MNVNTELGHKIKALREKKGVKQAELAREIEIAPSYLSRMEKGELRVSPAKLQRIANFLAVSIEELMTFQTLETQLESLDPSIHLKRALQEKEDQIRRIQQNVESFLLKNLEEYRRMEIELNGPIGARKRAEKRLFNWRALTLLLDRQSTSPDFFLTDLYTKNAMEEQESAIKESEASKSVRPTKK